LLIADIRLPIADGQRRKLPHHFFNRQSAIGNENLAFGCGYAALGLCVSLVNAIDFFTASKEMGCA